MYDFLNFSISVIAMTATVISTFIFILLNKQKIKQILIEEKIDNLYTILSRRKFMLSSSFIAIFGVYSLFKINFIEKKIKTFLLLFLPNANQLVLNTNTGIIHHKIFCKNHLPKEKNTQKNIKLSPNIKFHQSKKVQMLYHISQDVSIEDSVQILLLAVENNPTSVHLYDKLIKLLGTIKRYEAIHLLLNNAEYRLIKKISLLNIKTKEYKQYNKALNHIKLQQKKALYRAKYKAINS